LRLGTDRLPEKSEIWASRWKSLHPGWLHILWTPRTLPELRNKRLFDSCGNFACRSDILKYELLHLLGGVCVDIDVEPLRPFDPLLDATAFVGELQAGGVHSPGTAIMGSESRHPFYAQLIERLEGWARRRIDSTPPMCTGAGYFKTQLEVWESAENDRSVRTLPQSAFPPATSGPDTQPPESAKLAYAVHHCWRTWADSDAPMFRTGFGSEPS
jgi:hypothetical protein